MIACSFILSRNLVQCHMVSRVIIVAGQVPQSEPLLLRLALADHCFYLFSDLIHVIVRALPLLIPVYLTLACKTVLLRTWQTPCRIIILCAKSSAGLVTAHMHEAAAKPVEGNNIIRKIRFENR